MVDIFLSINNREQVIQLPIVPEYFGVQFSNNNETFNTIAQGDLNLLGSKGLKSLAIESFFPNNEYPYSKSKQYTGDGFIQVMEKWIERRIPIRIIVTSKNETEVVNLPVTIDGFEYGYDKTGDVVYSLTLREFRFVGV